MTAVPVPAAHVAVAAERRHLTLTVLICAYTLERWADVTAAVDSVRRQTLAPEQTIVIIDHNPELLERSRAAFPDVRCLASTGPRGLSGARNTGVGAATGDVVAFLDDDAAADPHWAENLLDAYDDDQVLGVGGGVVPEWRAPRPVWFPDEFLWVVGCSYEGLPAGRAEVRNPIGANMSFRRDVLEETGGFDTGIGRLGKDAAGCEETELSIRARRLRPGSRILVDPAATCRHAVTPDRVTRRYFRRRCWAEGRSKAIVSGLAGADLALSSERRYVARTLPVGIARGVRAALRGDIGGLTRALAIVEGASLTALGYATGRLRR